MYFCQTAAGPFQALTPWCLADQPFTLAVVVPSMRFGTRREFYGFRPPAHQEAKLQQHLKFQADCKSSFFGGGGGFAGLKLRSVRSDPHNEHASHLQDFTVPPNSSPNEPVTSLPQCHNASQSIVYRVLPSQRLDMVHVVQLHNAPPPLLPLPCKSLNGPCLFGLMRGFQHCFYHSVNAVRGGDARQ